MGYRAHVMGEHEGSIGEHVREMGVSHARDGRAREITTRASADQPAGQLGIDVFVPEHDPLQPLLRAHLASVVAGKPLAAELSIFARSAPRYLRWCLNVVIHDPNDGAEDTMDWYWERELFLDEEEQSSSDGRQRAPSPGKRTLTQSITGRPAPAPLVPQQNAATAPPPENAATASPPASPHHWSSEPLMLAAHGFPPPESTPSPPLQAKGQLRDRDDLHRLAASGLQGSTGTMPYREQIQRSFGSHDISHITAHTGGSSADACDDLGAIAYAMGTHVAFKSAPSLHTAAHEAAHVVQQHHGVQLQGGVGQEGDAYERHADAVADLVVRGQSAESLLSSMAPAGRSSAPSVQLEQAPNAPSSGCQPPAGMSNPPGAANPRYRELLREYRRRLQEGSLNELQVAAVEQALRDAETSIRRAEALAQQGSTTGYASAGALMLAGGLLADDATGIGVADDVAIPFVLLAAGVLYLTSRLQAPSTAELADAQQQAANAVANAIRTMEDAMARPVPRAIPAPRVTTRRRRGPLPINWPHLGGRGLPLVAPNPVHSITVGRFLSRAIPPARDTRLIEQYKQANPLQDRQAVHHVTPLFLGGPDSLDNLTAVWISYHNAGHAALRIQPQLAALGMPTDLYQHPPGTQYTVAAIV